MLNAPRPTPHAPRAPKASGAVRRRWTFALALAVLIVLLLVRPWALLPGSSLQSGGGAPSSATLPDPPTGREQALLAQLDAARPDDPPPDEAGHPVARLLGDHYVETARPFAALWAYALAGEAQSADRQRTFRLATTLGLARALERALFHDEAIARLKEVLARQPQQPQAVAHLAELYLRTGQPEAALPLLRRAGTAFADSAEGAVLEGRVLQALGDAKGALQAYRRAIGLDGQNAVTFHRLGLLAFSQGDLFTARQNLGAARVLAPANPRYDVDLGRTYASSSKREEWDQAARYYMQAAKRSPRFAPAYYEAGVWYSRHQRWREAVERLDAAVACDPGHADAHELLARALDALGSRAEAHRHRGMAYAARDLRMAALREYQAWAARAPNDPDAELAVAQSYFETQQVDQAKARLETARRKFPRASEIRERLIAFYLLEADRARARLLCQEWLRAEPGSRQALYLLGRATDEQQVDEAIRLFEQLVAGEPENPQWLGTLGETLLKLPGTDSVPRAVDLLARAAAGMPDEPRWRLMLAQGLQRLGQIAEARRQALRALDLDPHQGSAYTLVVQLARQERGGDAGRGGGPLSLFAGLVRALEARSREEMRLWQATWQRPHDPDAYAALAAFLLRTGSLEKAEGQLAEALRLRPDWPEARARLERVRRLREAL